MSELYPNDEKTSLLQLKNDDQKAFEHLYHLYSSRIYGKILKLTKSEIIAGELLQDTFVKVWEKRQLINEEFPFKAWLYRVAENEVYMFYRKLARDRKLQEYIIETFDESHSPTEGNLLLKESNELLNRAVEMLPQQCRQVFTLCRIEGRSYEETGSLLGISSSTVSNHLVKAGKSIRSYILESGREHISLILSLFLPSISLFC